VFVTEFPKFSQQVKQPDFVELSRVYQISCQLISITVLPAAGVLALFSREVLFALSGNPRLVAAVSRVVVMVAIGSVLNALMNVPYALQLAFGWTRLRLITNAIAVVVMVPLEYWLAKRHGIVGAAAGWVVLNGGYVVFQLRVMHTRLLRGEQWRWYLKDVGLPLLGAAAVLIPLRVFLSAPGGRLAIGLYLAVVGATAVIAAAATVPEVRSRARALVEQRKLRHGRTA
jgi:O-antigen/teichoic acid export membrane protein